MGYKQRALERAEELGAEVTDTGATIHIDAPAGHTWVGFDGQHTIIIPYRDCTGDSWKTEAWSDAIEWMRGGVEPCRVRELQGECDVCDEWEADEKSDIPAEEAC